MRRNRKILFNQPVQVTGLAEDSAHTTAIPTKGIIIPFTTRGINTAVNLTTDSTGNSTNGIIAAFGNSSLAATNAVSISNNHFTQTTAHYNSFVMPYDITLQSISMVAVSYSAITPSTDVKPYVAIATAPSGSFDFTLNPYTKAMANPFSGSVVAGATNSGMITDLNMLIPAGTRVAIVCGLDADGGTFSGVFNYSGALYFTRG